MNDQRASQAAVVCWLAAGLAVSAGSAGAADVVLEGFEGAKTYQAAGKATVVQAADVVTEGQSALQLDGGAAITINVPAGAANVPGWLKIDTFENQPVVAALHVSIAGRTGYVRPGKDVLAVPIGLASRAGLNPWPPAAQKLTIRNTSTHSVVIDNIRLVPPAKAPAAVVLLDFGPEQQVLWPGFEPAGAAGTGISWKTGPTASHDIGYPDPLLGDFSGRRLAYRSQESLRIVGRKQTGTAWVWLTHYGYQYSPPAQYAARINGRPLLQHQVRAGQILATDALLSGRGEPWTHDWFERTFIPRIVERKEFPLTVGDNELELGNCQVAALVVADRKDSAAAKDYVGRLDKDLKRYRRQFVLGAQTQARCDIAPTEEETKAGVMVFHPSADNWLVRDGSVTTEDRSRPVKLAVLAGSMATAAFVVAPTADTGRLRATAGALQSPTAGALPAGSCRIQAAETLPVVRDGSVCRQPFTIASSFRQARARQLQWFILQVRAPRHQATGSYKGSIRITHGRGRATLPVEVTVVRLPAAKKLPPATLAMGAPIDTHEIYRYLKLALPKPFQLRAAQQMKSALAAGGFNASTIRGPSFQQGRLVNGSLVAMLKDRLYVEGEANKDVSFTNGLALIKEVQPGTAKYRVEVAKLVKATADEAGKNRLSNYVLYCGRFHGANGPVMAERVASVRAAGGRPAVSASPIEIGRLKANARSRLFADLDTLQMYPGRGMAAIGKEFKAAGEDKTFLVRTDRPDPFTCGFFSWAVGADGVVVDLAFSRLSQFNAFFFDGRSLLLPTPTVGGFEPTLPMLLLAQGRADYDLARRCDALIEAARKKGIGAADLLRTLAEIRAECITRPPRYDDRRLQSTSVSPSKVLQWRRQLVEAAGKLAQEMAKPPSAAAKAAS